MPKRPSRAQRPSRPQRASRSQRRSRAQSPRRAQTSSRGQSSSRTQRDTTFTSLLGDNPVVVADGAMGTALFDGGLEPGGSPELMNVDRPDVIESIHGSYIDAGADIVLTNTFGGNALRLQLHKIAHRAAELNVAAAQVARRAASSVDRRIAVAGSVGPTGALLEPYGLLTPSEARAAFFEQIEGLVEGGVDVIWIETMSSLEELQAAYDAALRFDLPIAATMSFDSHGHTMMGIHPSALGEWAAQLPAPVSGLGANCGIGPDDVVTAASAIQDADPAAVVIAKGNCGVPLFSGVTMEYPTTPRDMAAYVDGALAAGARIIGACCGSTPTHIVAIRDRVDKVAQTDPAHLRG